ncbi:tetratricopeptide (TPR) repeat protein [Catenulispora sp. GAS73]|uniref:AAA family ATPase n=1 Tax=Catenulispora sp. GAS73 TaxID=3156269 RepID=UPI00351803DA
MTTTDRLARLFADEGAAETVLEHFDQRNLTVEVDDSSVLPCGNSGARLVVVILSNKSGPKTPKRYIAKMVPAGRHRPSDEGRRSRAALNIGPGKFADDHLATIIHGPILCPDGAQVIVQEIAGGSLAGNRPLSMVDTNALAETCDRVRLGLLTEWVSRDYEHRSGTVAELLELELRDSIREDGWLRAWAEDRNLLDPACSWIEVVPGEVLPNPFQLLPSGAFADDRPLTYLVGRSHGDLHADNILIPHCDDEPMGDRFWLIDLAEYDDRAPLSRDVATLAVSLIAKSAGQLNPRDQEDLIRDVISDGATATGRSATRPRSTFAEVVRALWSPEGTFLARNWLDAWRAQARISCLAQALLHAAYNSVGQDGRWWSFRLAARLAHKLVPGEVPAASRARRLGPEMCAEPPAAVPVPWLASSRVRTTREFVDRKEERARLRAELQDDATKVITVTGPTGAGKTRLVEQVLIELGWDAEEVSDRRVRRHDAANSTRLDMKAFLNAIEEHAPSKSYMSGSAYRARMQTALDTYTGSPLVFIVESAECLLDDAGRLRDPDLDETLEMLSLRSGGQVKVVLVGQEVPRGDGTVMWPVSARRIPLSGLEEPDFREFVASLDGADEDGLTALAPSAFAQVHRRLRGNPRLAELLHALLGWADRDLGPEDVPAWLAAMSEEEVPQKLTDKLISGLTVGQQRVIEALAAFGTPVAESTVSALLDSVLPAKQVHEVLRTATQRRIIRKSRDESYYLPRADIDLVLKHLPYGDPYEPTADGPTRRHLLHLAARVLESEKKNDDNVTRASDLYAHFAQVDILVRAGMCDEAHEAIVEIDRLLRRWNQGTLLREHREGVRGKLDDPYAEMENHAALGSLYSSLELFAAADGSYRKALSLAQSHHSMEDLRRIYIDRGWMYFEHNHFAKAADQYANGLAIAQEEGEEAAEDRAAALEGLADCARASGRFAEAIRLGNDALAIAEAAESRRAFGNALKLTRWLADVDRMNEAESMLARAKNNLSDRYDDISAQASYLDGAADLAVRLRGVLSRTGAENHLYEAEHNAHRAVELALEQRDPVVLRQARTTLCVIHLQRDDLPAARWQIELAVRHRRAGQFLLIAALRSVVAWRCDEVRKATELFAQLREEAQERVDADDHDFAAADMLGLTLCAEALANGTSLLPAIETFRIERRASEPAPGLVRQLRFLIEQLDHDGHRADLLRPVLAAIV